MTHTQADPAADTLPSLDASSDRGNQGTNRSAGGDAGACLSDDELCELSEGRATEAVRQRIRGHLGECYDCCELAALVVGEIYTHDPSLTAFAPGSMLADRYRIERFIGRGGMGEVYEAFDSLMGNRVALKTVLCTALDDARVVRKLFDEVLNAQRVAHPNVCRVNELHEHFDANPECPPVPFFTMEFIEGPRLASLIEQGRLTIEQARVIAGQLLEGLRAAHSKGVLHLDFKSDNVMLRSEEGQPQAVITDFGLSRALDAQSRLRTSERLQGMGTLPYMSIEQLECRPNLGPGADVYAFGVVVYEMLTGKRPFTGESLSSILLQQLRERPPAPSRSVAGLSPCVDSLVMRCLARRASDRFSDAGDALAALQRCGDWRARQLPWWHRRRWGALVGAVALAWVATVGFTLDPKVDRASGVEAVAGSLRPAPPSANARTPGAPSGFEENSPRVHVRRTPEGASEGPGNVAEVVSPQPAPPGSTATAARASRRVASPRPARDRSPNPPALTALSSPRPSAVQPPPPAALDVRVAPKREQVRPAPWTPKRIPRRLLPFQPTVAVPPAKEPSADAAH